MNTDYASRYQEYLKSKHWVQLKFDSGKRWGERCFSCASTKYVEFHHLTYRNLTDCTADDVIPLCRNCHKGAHFSPLYKKVKLAQTNDEKRTILLRALRGTTRPLEARVDPAYAAFKERQQKGKRAVIESIREDRRFRFGQRHAAIIQNETPHQRHQRELRELKNRKAMNRLIAAVN